MYEIANEDLTLKDVGRWDVGSKTTYRYLSISGNWSDTAKRLTAEVVTLHYYIEQLSFRP